MLDLALIQLPNPALASQMYNSLGVMYLASVVEQAGYSVKIADLRHGDGLPRARFYGFSCTTPEITYAKQLAKQVRGKTIVGGGHPSLLPEDCWDDFDHIVMGEGEEVILDILNGRISSKGIIAPRIKNLDTIPYPARNKVHFPYNDQIFEGEKYGHGALTATLIATRGCPFLCAFCLPKDTQVLMTDMSWQNIQDVKVGDMVVGVRSDGRWKYTMSEVTNTFRRKAMVYAIETENGTVYSTKEHPWLMHSNFKSIKDIEDNEKYKASFASERTVLRKLSLPIHAKKQTKDYKKGYIAGAIVGDGCLRIKHIVRDYGEYNYLNLSIVGDYEMLDRVLGFAHDLNIHMHEREFNGGKYYRCNRAVVCDRHWVCKTVEKLIYHANETYEYKRGFLSGFYDAEGSFSQGVLRISNLDEGVKLRVQNYLTQFGFQSVIESKAIRLTGGQAEHIKFLSIILPAVVHKRMGLFGQQVYNSTPIVSVRQIGVMDVYNLSTSTENFIADGFVTHNCGNIFRSITTRSVSNIIGEMELIKAQGITHFKFMDDCFTLHPQFETLCGEIKKLNISYIAHTRSDLMTSRIAKLLAESGCYQSGLGVECADDNVLLLNNKKETVEDHIRAIRTLKEAGIKVKPYWITGLPGESNKTIERNKEFMIVTQPDKWTISTFTPYPGCDIWKHPADYGIEIVNKDWTKWWNYVDQYNHVIVGQTQEQMYARYRNFYNWLKEETWKIGMCKRIV